MKKMTGESTNITEENLSAMRQLFPEAFEEGKIDFDILRQLLGDYVDDEEERYSFKWNGKGHALRLSQTPSTGTLRPCKEESVDWDTTHNLYIEGDNLEVLKLLQKSYHGRVKMIYIDPPYNTGSDFVYKDDFRDNVENYKRITGQVDGEGHRIGTNNESNGRFHTDWLNMMYPRLRLARNLLADDGVIFISIDDNEVCNLKRICDYIFSEENMLAALIWNKQHSQQQGVFKRYHESILVYGRNSKGIGNIQCGEGVIEAGALKKVSKANPSSEFKFPKGTRFDAPDGTEYHGTYGKSETVTVVEGRMIAKDGKLLEDVTLAAGWTQKDQMTDFFSGKEVIDTKGQRVIEFFFNSAGKLKCTKERSSITPASVLPEYGMVSEQSRKLMELMDGNYFDTPKPINMIRDFAKWFCKGDHSKREDIILDFFSGSATTAHAVMQLNAEDGGNRRFIMVQLPETTPVDSEAHQAGYANICEIGKERIRRAGKKVKAECADAERAAALDIGFKVFKLDSSNLQKWQPQPEDLMASLEASMDNFLPDRTTLDVVYEIALKLGLELSYEVEAREVDGHTVYVIGAGALMICLDSQISMDTAEALLRLHEEYEPETWQVVFRDTGFLSDQEKTNIKETLKSAGLDEDAFISI